MADLPPSNDLYKKQSYWDERFKQEKEYDWLAKYKDFKDLLNPYLKHTDKILIIGCGNSTFSADLYDDGYTNIINIDYSSIVISNMYELNKDRINMKWLCMDMTNMTFSEQFDVVIDKAAMDALLVDEGSSWDPKEEVREQVRLYLTCVTNILKEKGFYFQISFGQPHFRKLYLEKRIYGWTFNYQLFGNGLGYYFFTMEKDNQKATEYFNKKELESLTSNEPIVPVISMDELPDPDISSIQLSTDDL